jgi:hypothetical protein
MRFVFELFLSIYATTLSNHSITEDSKMQRFKEAIDDQSRRWICFVLPFVSAVASVAAVDCGQYDELCEVSVSLDSGLVKNAGNELSSVFTATITVPEATSLILHFDVVQLSGDPTQGNSAVVRLKSLVDESSADLTQRALADNRFFSPHYNGESLLLELMAYPGTGQSRIVIDTALAGPPDDGSAEWLCFMVDVFRRADANADGNVDLSDAITILGHLFIACTPFACPDAYDANDDGQIDISDPIAIIGFLFLGTSSGLPAPFTDCGEDPTQDDFEGANLGCHYYGPSCSS